MKNILDFLIGLNMAINWEVEKYMKDHPFAIEGEVRRLFITEIITQMILRAKQ